MSIRKCQLTHGPNFCLILLFLFLAPSVTGVKEGIARIVCLRTTTRNCISYVCAGPIDLRFSSIASRRAVHRERKTITHIQVIGSPPMSFAYPSQQPFGESQFRQPPRK